MATLIVIICVLALLHFVYDGIVAPSLRLRLRFRLFALRDRLRDVKFVEGDRVSDEVFLCLQNGINGATRLLSIFDVSTMVQASREIERDKEVAQRLAKREELLRWCPVEEVAEIRRQVGTTMFYALCVNSGAWFLFVAPIGVIVVCIKSLLQWVKSLFLTRVKSLFLISEEEVVKMFPNPVPVRV